MFLQFFKIKSEIYCVNVNTMFNNNITQFYDLVNTFSEKNPKIFSDGFSFH